MPEIKTQTDTKVIISLTELEAAHLYAFLAAANHSHNEHLYPLESALSSVTDGTHIAYDYDADLGYFTLCGEDL